MIRKVEVDHSRSRAKMMVNSYGDRVDTSLKQACQNTERRNGASCIKKNLLIIEFITSLYIIYNVSINLYSVISKIPTIV